jgi:hypothetical protein
MRRSTCPRWAETSTELYSRVGRPSIAPEKSLRALLQVLCTIRSEQLLIEQLDYNLLFRWVDVDAGADLPVAVDEGLGGSGRSSGDPAAPRARGDWRARPLCA